MAVLSIFFTMPAGEGIIHEYILPLCLSRVIENPSAGLGLPLHSHFMSASYFPIGWSSDAKVHTCGL